MLKLKSPAKLNLYLRILNKRPDGYHNIVTLFERIDLCDDVVLKERKSGIKIVCDDPMVPLGPENLAYRAAKALMDHAGLNRGIQIRIKKRIPTGGGLGGGSSNAACVLLGLNRLWKLGLSRKELMAQGAKIGADVNFFLLDEKLAVGTEKGEKLKALAVSRSLWHVLVISGKGLSTGEIYGRWDKLHPAGRRDKIPLTQAMADVKILHHSIQKKNFSLLGKSLHNDLEESAQSEDSNILKIKELLRFCARACVLVSGSGPTVFCVAPSRKEAIRLRRDLMSSNKPDSKCQILVAKTW